MRAGKASENVENNNINSLELDLSEEILNQIDINQVDPLSEFDESNSSKMSKSKSKSE